MGLFSGKKLVDYDPDVDYSSLKTKRYKDSPGYDFYRCPVCGGEYLATFITTKHGKTMCIDCWEKN